MTLWNTKVENFEPPKTIKVIITDRLEYTYTAVVRIEKDVHNGVWIIQKDGTVTEIPYNYLHLQIKTEE